MMHELHNTKNRRAFTLIEILVVIAIIGILAALGAWGVFAMIGNQQSRNTQNTIMVVNKVLQDHWKYVIEEAKNDLVISPSVIALAGGSAGDPDGRRARVLWIKFRLMEAFPQAFSDITTPIPYTMPTAANPYIPVGQQRYISDYQKKIVNLVAARTNSNYNSNPFAATPSSACLLIALSASRGGSSLRQDDIKFAVKDSDGDGISEIVDGWNRPLMFTRFDVSSFAQQANPAAQNPAAAGNRDAKFADPNDADGMLLTSGWYNSVMRPAFEKLFQYPPSFQYAISPNNGASAYFVIPSVMSAGKDGVMGSPDDIYSYQLRGGN